MGCKPIIGLKSLHGIDSIWDIVNTSNKYSYRCDLGMVGIKGMGPTWKMLPHPSKTHLPSQQCRLEVPHISPQHTMQHTLTGLAIMLAITSVKLTGDHYELFNEALRCYIDGMASHQCVDSVSHLVTSGSPDVQETALLEYDNNLLSDDASHQSRIYKLALGTTILVAVPGAYEPLSTVVAVDGRPDAPVLVLAFA